MAKEVSIFTTHVLLEAGELFGADREDMLSVLPDPSVAEKKWGGIDWDHAVDLMRVAFRPVGTGSDLVPAGQDYLNKRYKTRSAHLYGQYTSWEKALWVAKHLMASRIVKGHTIDYEKTGDPDRFVVTMTLPEQLTPYPDFLWFCTGVWTGSSDLAALKHRIHSVNVDSHRAVADITFDKRSRASRAVHNPIYSRWKTRRDLTRSLREEKQHRLLLDTEAKNLETVLDALSDAVLIQDGIHLSPQNQAGRDLLTQLHATGLSQRRPEPGDLIETEKEFFRARSRTPLPDQSGDLLVLANITREVAQLRELEQATDQERNTAVRDVEKNLGRLLQDIKSGILQKARQHEANEICPQLRNLANLTDLCRQQAKALATGQDREVGNRQHLEAALKEMAKDYKEVFGYTVEIRFQGSPPLQGPDPWRDLYLLLREAVRNAYRHSGGDRVGILFTPTTISVCDNGCGFDSRPQKETGLGCQSIRDRAKRIGALPEHLSAPENGWSLTFPKRRDEGERT